ADGKVHELSFELPVQTSCWVALREFPQLHTNPVIVKVGGRPIRASRDSALWCIATIAQLWIARAQTLPRAAARRGPRCVRPGHCDAPAHCRRGTLTSNTTPAATVMPQSES